MSEDLSRYVELYECSQCGAATPYKVVAGDDTGLCAIKSSCEVCIDNVGFETLKEARETKSDSITVLVRKAMTLDEYQRERFQRGATPLYTTKNDFKLTEKVTAAILELEVANAVQ